MPEGFDRVAFGNLNEARVAVTDETAAILVEPIQGEGGINPPPEGYLRGLRQMADEFGLVLIMDEIQTGMGRTGKLFAHQWEEGAEPDVMAVAKGIGGGFPMAAFLAREEVAQALTPGTHGTTFGGNPLAMAVGNAVLDVILADGFMEGVQSAAMDLWARLEGLVARHPSVLKGVRGKGLMIGLVCVRPVAMSFGCCLRSSLARPRLMRQRWLSKRPARGSRRKRDNNAGHIKA
jgi:acetylornithine/N-succinyldiaminopimelate aminotransferase